MHMSFTCWMIPKGQPDLHYGGTFFSVMIIYLLNLALLAALLDHRVAAAHLAGVRVGALAGRGGLDALGHAEARSALVSGTAEKLQFLLDLQENLGGCIPFDRWMREALYHEKFGYYTANIREFGRRGDFTTWPAVSESLGRSPWPDGSCRTSLRTAPNVIEIGAGNGELAASVIKSDRLVEETAIPHR